LITWESLLFSHFFFCIKQHSHFLLLLRYYGCGIWAGKLFCMVVALGFLFWRFLEWYSPQDSIEKAIDFPSGGYPKQERKSIAYVYMWERKKDPKKVKWRQVFHHFLILSILLCRWNDEQKKRTDRWGVSPMIYAKKSTYMDETPQLIFNLFIHFPSFPLFGWQLIA